MSAAQKQVIVDRTGLALTGLIGVWLVVMALRDVPTFVDQTVIGISNGMLIALVALGYTMVYGIIELINFAHADVFMLGSMICMQLIVWAGVGPGSGLLAKVAIIVVALVVCMAFCGALNVAIERIAYRPLRSAPPLAALITAIGMSFVLANIGMKIWGPSQVNVPNLMGNATIVGSLRVKDVLIVAVTVPLLMALTWFVGSTRLGKAMRATAQDREAAAIMGIDVNRTIATTFLIGGVLAGAGGLLYALVNTTTVWNAGLKNGLFAFTAAVLGGIGNLTGAVLGGIMIGVFGAWAALYVGDRWTDVVIFSILVLVLVFKPTGLLGEQEVSRA